MKGWELQVVATLAGCEPIVPLYASVDSD